MSNTNTGGPAFPLHAEIRPALDTEWCGMTLRDYFAAKAMQATFDSPIEATAEGKDYIAMHAYKMADAMLKAREA
jgi:hypothetical protein